MFGRNKKPIEPEPAPVLSEYERKMWALSQELSETFGYITSYGPAFDPHITPVLVEILEESSGTTCFLCQNSRSGHHFMLEIGILYPRGIVFVCVDRAACHQRREEYERWKEREAVAEQERVNEAGRRNRETFVREVRLLGEE